MQRKAAPADFDNLAELALTLNLVERRWRELAARFEWNFIRANLAVLIERLTAYQPTSGPPHDGERT